MTKCLKYLAPVACLFAGLAAPVAAEVSALPGEGELAALLEDRVAGDPVTCIRDSLSDRVQIIDRTAMVFGRGDTLYVNRPLGVQLLDDWDLPIFYKWGGSRLCEYDRVELVNRGSSISGPMIFLDEFVPYTRAAK